MTSRKIHAQTAQSVYVILDSGWRLLFLPGLRSLKAERGYTALQQGLEEIGHFGTISVSWTILDSFRRRSLSGTDRIGRKDTNDNRSLSGECEPQKTTLTEGQVYDPQYPVILARTSLSLF